MRGYVLALLIWPVLAQVSSACPACQAGVGASSPAPVHVHATGYAVPAPVAGCSQCVAGAVDGCNLYGYAFCSPSDPQEFYAELYRRYYIELERLGLNARNRRAISGQPVYQNTPIRQPASRFR